MNLKLRRATLWGENIWRMYNKQINKFRGNFSVWCVYYALVTDYSFYFFLQLT